MNQSIVAQTTSTVAYKFGIEDATSGAAFSPECIFVRRSDQVAYAAGFESVAGVSTFTAAFTGSIIPAPITVQNLKRNDNEFVRRTDSNAKRIFQQAEAQSRRLARMAAETAAFLGVDDGDIIFA